MAKEAYYCTVKELNKLGRDAIPVQLRSNTHLIYSSPATLAFNSPGAEGFGVKRAGLAVPDSIMLIVAPGCCGRNTSLISSMREYDNRFFYLMMDETDIVTGRHLKKIPKAVEEICNCCEKSVRCDDLYYLCRCSSWDGHGACVQKSGRKSRTSGSTMLHVRADKRRKKAADGACTSVFIFPSGAKEEKRKCGKPAWIFLAADR
mgnify:CR=1 FL=1